MSDPIVAIIMGSDSDLPVMSAAADVLTELQIPFELTLVSAHRTPDRLVTFARGAEARGIGVIIAGAGGAAHLPGMVASLTVVPVVGVPIAATRLQGLDALLSIVQMPTGVPVATVAIDNAANAALLVAQMLGIADPLLRERLKQRRAQLQEAVISKAQRIERRG